MENEQREDRQENLTKPELNPQTSCLSAFTAALYPRGNSQDSHTDYGQVIFSIKFLYYPADCETHSLTPYPELLKKKTKLPLDVNRE